MKAEARLPVGPAEAEARGSGEQAPSGPAQPESGAESLGTSLEKKEQRRYCPYVKESGVFLEITEAGDELRQRQGKVTLDVEGKILMWLDCETVEQGKHSPELLAACTDLNIDPDTFSAATKAAQVRRGTGINGGIIV